LDKHFAFITLFGVSLTSYYEIEELWSSQSVHITLTSLLLSYNTVSCG